MKLFLALVAGLLALPLAVLLAAVVGLLPSNAISTPPKWEAAIGMRAVDASLERRTKGLRNPIAADDAAALSAGQKIYVNNCAGCHGDRSGPSKWGSRAFYPRIPQFWQEGSDVRPEEAYAAIHDGIRYSGMGAWRDLMNEDDMWKVANFVARIDRTRRASAPSKAAR